MNINKINLIHRDCCYYCINCIKVCNSTRAFCRIVDKEIDYNDICEAYED